MTPLSDIIIKPLNQVHTIVDCESSVASELGEYFTFDVPGAKFMPSYRAKLWDGKISLYNKGNQTIYTGLIAYVEKFASDRGYSLENLASSKKISKEHVDMVRAGVEVFFRKNLLPHVAGKPITANEHQLAAVTHAIAHKRCLLMSPTASGKSLIIYALLRYYLSILPDEKKVLIVVPTIGLVTQMLTDFADYSSHDPKGWVADDECHGIFQGQDKGHKTKRVYVSTWQSIFRQQKQYYNVFGAVIIDEAHNAKSTSVTGVLSKLTECKYRVGTTGTIDGMKVNKLVIEGLLGPVYQVTTSKKLMDQNIISELSIRAIMLHYTDEEKKYCRNFDYNQEIEWLVTHERRNNFIIQLAEVLKGNTLILFNYVEKHGIPLEKALREHIEKTCPGRKVYLIHGQTEAEDREAIRQIMEKESDSIVVASFGTMSTGVSIRRLHNLIFASPSKSRIRVLQSIGRQLRKSEHKNMAYLYDLADDLSWKSHQNYTLGHFLERVKYYDEEQFDYQLTTVHI